MRLERWSLCFSCGLSFRSELATFHLWPSRTSKLPQVDLQRPPAAIGRNTVHAMQSGLLFGYVSMVEGMVARFRTELGESMKVIATGGLAEIVARETKILQIIAPWLTLDGLRILWDMNHHE